MRSSFPAQASRRHAASISAPGSIASVPRCLHARNFSTSGASLWKTAPGSREEAASLVSSAGAGPHSKRETHLRRGRSHHNDGGDVDMRSGMSANIYFATPIDGREIFTTPTANSGCSAAGRAHIFHRIRPYRRCSWRNLRFCRARQIQGRAH